MPFNPSTPNNTLPLLTPETWSPTPEVMQMLIPAARNLAELSGLCQGIKDPNWIVNALALQESKHSAAIDNITAANDDVFEAGMEGGLISMAAQKIYHTRNGLYRGMASMLKRQFIISPSVITEVAQVMLLTSAGIRDTPGTPMKNTLTDELIYTPPSGAPVIREKMDNLERCINDPNFWPMDPLLKMAFIHYQLEAIQPFAEGSGRTARVVNNLYLVQQGLLPHPLLSMSSYIVKNRFRYYQAMDKVTSENNWNDWLLYNLAAVAETAKKTTGTIKQLLALRETMNDELQKALGASYKPELLPLLFDSPYIKIESLEKKEIAHRQTASTWFKKLVQAGIILEQRRGRTLYFINDRLIELLTA